MFGHDQVHDCAVFGIPDPELGEAIAVAIQPEPDTTIDTGQLQDYLRSRIASYMIPRKILIKDSLPRDDNGKIFKRKLRDAFWADAGRRI
jgi:long-chain acyl-CoA synthetase